jgi:hypothetical protein
MLPDNVLLQVEAREKAGKKQKKPAKASSSNHNSERLTGGSGGGKEQQQHQGSPSKQHRQSHAGPAGPSSSTADAGAAPQLGRSSSSTTAGRQIVLSDPAAAFVLVATQEYVRVYSVGHAVAADRTTMRKVTMHGTLQFASAFMACGAPALACLLEMDGEIHLQVCVLLCL